jgi:hypothetical protein
MPHVVVAQLVPDRPAPPAIREVIREHDIRAPRPLDELAVRAVEVGVAQLHATPRGILLRRFCTGLFHPRHRGHAASLKPLQPWRRLERRRHVFHLVPFWI